MSSSGTISHSHLQVTFYISLSCSESLHLLWLALNWSAAAAAAAAKSLQSCPTLCNPRDGNPPGSPVPGFARQEHWSGLPFPSPMHESEKWKWSRSSCPTPSHPMDCSPPGSSVHGIYQARVLEWGAIAFSNWSMWLQMALFHFCRGRVIFHCVDMWLVLHSSAHVLHPNALENTLTQKDSVDSGVQLITLAGGRQFPL